MSTISNDTDIDYQLMASLFIILQLWVEKMQLFRQSLWKKRELYSNVSNYQPQGSVSLMYLNLDVFNLNYANESSRSVAISSTRPNL
jgi:hypothetical protein